MSGLGRSCLVCLISSLALLATPPSRAKGDCQSGTPLHDGARYPAGPQARGIVVADFNADGIADAAVITSQPSPVASGSPGSVQVYLGQGGSGVGDGTFSAPQSFVAGDFPTDVAAADLDGDGMQDLVIACGYDNAIVTLHGRGDGTFDPPVGHPVGSLPFGLSVVDLDADGVPDIAVTNSGSASLSVFKGVRSSGAFDVGPRQDYPVGPNPLGIVSGDFDGDGVQDLAAAVYDLSSVVVLKGMPSTLSFTAARGFPVGANPYDLATADLNADGFLDLATTTAGDRAVVLLGTPAGGFLGPLSSPTPGFNAALAIADYDSDGILDLALTNFSGSSISVLLGNREGSSGNGRFTLAGTSEAGANPFPITAGDFNGDGRADVATATFNGAELVIFLSGCPPVTPTIPAGQWQSQGIAICSQAGDQRAPTVAPDLVGGTFIAWLDSRPAASGGPGAYVQHVTQGGGIVAGWPADGLGVSQTGGESALNAISDGSGGVILTWLDSSFHVRVQRLTATGQPYAGWAANGVIASSFVSGAPGIPGVSSSTPTIEALGDGSGGVILLWLSGRTVIAQHVTAAGQPDPGWGTGGLVFGPTNGIQMLGPVHGTTDMAGGVLIVWYIDSVLCQPGHSCQDFSRFERRHITSAGLIDPAWSGSESAYRPRIASDGAGGAFLVKSRRRIPYYEIYVEHVSQTGALGPDLLIVPNTFISSDVFATSDEVGGAILLWQNQSPAYYGTLRLNHDGNVQQPWTSSGFTLAVAPGGPSQMVMVPDGQGGAVYAWTDSRKLQADIYTTHLDPFGAVSAGSPSNGDPVCTLFWNQLAPSIATDAVGGTVIAWQDGRGSDYDIYAQRIAPDGPVATTVSLVSADAAPNRVSLTWHAAGDPLTNAAVERRETSTPWLRIGAVNSDGMGQVRYVDADVDPGKRYAYRLSYRSGAEQRYTSEAWIDVPRAAMLSLEGARPNPAVDHMTVSFSLVDGSSASLAVVDIAGRAVLRREVGSMGAGRHVMRLDLGPRLTPGIYWLRLSQGGRVLHASTVVIR